MSSYKYYETDDEEVQGASSDAAPSSHLVHESPLDTQVGGSHYKSMKIQPIEFAMANGLDPCQQKVIKYTTRWRTKNGLEDIDKAIHLLQLYRELITKYPDIKEKYQ